MPINKDKSITKNITMSKELAREIQRLADESKRSFSNQAAYLLEQIVKIKNQ